MRKTILAILLSLSFTVPVFAADIFTQQESAILSLYELMDLISETYAGGEIDIQELYENAALGMTMSLDDYSIFFTKDELDSFSQSTSGNINGIGIQFSSDIHGYTVISDVFAGTPAELSGLQPGDIIKQVDGIDIGMYESGRISDIVGSSEDPIISIQIERGGELKIFNITKAQIELATAELEPTAEPDIWRINISQIGKRTANELKVILDELSSREVKGIIIDMRGNPGGYADITQDICNMLVPSGPIYHTIDNDGITHTYSSQLKEVPFKNIVILVDENTASAAELIAAAMQDAKAATVVGKQTFGKGVIQSIYVLDSGDALKITTMEYLSRDKNKINNVGVTPDVVIETPAEILGFVMLHNDYTSDEIPSLKKILKYMGYETGDMDNVYNEATKTAILDIQKKADLNLTGHIDLETQYAVHLAFYKYMNQNDEALETAIKIIQDR